MNEYVYFGGKRIAMLPAGGSPVYYLEDMLGTSRVITTNSGVVCYDGDFYPYGGERTYTNTCPQNNYKFEGKERDAETGNDDFGARYYSNRYGRWLSADWLSVPAPVPYANFTNPQTLNLYSMVSDDPESFADLDGHCPVCALEELAESPEGQEVIDNAIGIVVAGAAAGYAATKGLFNSAADYAVSHPGDFQAPTDAPGYYFSKQLIQQQYQSILNENTSDSKPGTLGKSTTPAGKSSSGQNVNAYGEKLGPSNKPMRHRVNHSTRKAAKDAARQEGSTAPEEHGGEGTFHATDKTGKKVHNGTHHNYPH